MKYSSLEIIVKQLDKQTCQHLGVGSDVAEAAVPPHELAHLRVQHHLPLRCVGPHLPPRLKQRQSVGDGMPPRSWRGNNSTHTDDYENADYILIYAYNILLQDYCLKSSGLAHTH